MPVKQKTLLNVWSDEATDELKKLTKEGYSAALCTQMINKKFKTAFSRNGIIGKQHRLKLAIRVKKRIVKVEPPPQPKVKALTFGNNRVTEIQTQPLVPLRVVKLETRNLNLLDLDASFQLCRYIDDEKNYCGLQVMKGVYCKTHAALCYIPHVLRERRSA